MNFEHKVVLITGAASGIGAATALKFAELFAKLSLVDKNAEGLKSVRLLCESKSGRNHHIIVADLSRTKEVERVIPETIQRYGKLDVLVNSAGILTKETLLNDDYSDNYDKLMAVNLKAPIMLCKKAAPYLVETKGNVVNISSLAAENPVVGLSLYCVSKAGLVMFTKCMAKELAFKGVRANVILPGAVRTNIMKSFNENIDTEERYEFMSRQLPFGVSDPKEIAGLVSFVASESSRSITGSSYLIDGAYSLIFKGESFEDLKESASKT